MLTTPALFVFRNTALMAGIATTSVMVASAQTIPIFKHAGAASITPEDVKGLPAGSKPLIPVPQVIDVDGERKELSKQWISTIDMTSEVGCTGTLIGPRVLLTAAHCVERWPTIALAFRGEDNMQTVLADCDQHPIYRRRATSSKFDFALCHLRSDYPMKVFANVENDPSYNGLVIGRVDVRFERLSLDDRLRPAARILLAGFGCSSAVSETLDGNLRAGTSTVSRVSRAVLQVGGPRVGASSILCAGDSGGAAFATGTADIYGPRVIVGVNSSSYLRFGISYLARTSSPAFRAFLVKWRRKWSMPKICGISSEIQDRCHQ